MNSAMEYLRKYIRTPQLFSLSDVNVGDIPEFWADALSQVGRGRVAAVLDSWEAFRPQLPLVFDFLATHLQDVQLLHDGMSIRLLYELERDGKPMYYAGGNPKSKTFRDPVEIIWTSLSEEMKCFYDNLHNGWYYLASESLGPSPIEHWFTLDEQEWGLLDDIDDPGCDLSNLMAVYTNGMGAYVALNVRRQGDYGDVIWWKEKSPTKNVDIWGVIDAWTEIGLKN